MARLEVRSAQVTLRAPQNRPDEVPESIPVSLVWAVEQDAPDGVKGLDWTLLTTNEIVDYESAVDMIRCYTARWVIEEFHRVLKSGCRVEQMQFETADRLAPAIGILSVVAWRVLSLTKQAHADQEMNVSEVASSEEVSVLSQWLRAQGEKTHSITTVRAFHMAVARLGGFQGRKSDGMPGTKTTWQGLTSLEMLVLGYRLATQNKM